MSVYRTSTRILTHGDPIDIRYVRKGVVPVEGELANPNGGTNWSTKCAIGRFRRQRLVDNIHCWNNGWDVGRRA